MPFSSIKHRAHIGFGGGRWHSKLITRPSDCCPAICIESWVIILHTGQSQFISPPRSNPLHPLVSLPLLQLLPLYLTQASLHLKQTHHSVSRPLILGPGRFLVRPCPNHLHHSRINFLMYHPLVEFQHFTNLVRYISVTTRVY